MVIKGKHEDIPEKVIDFLNKNYKWDKENWLWKYSHELYSDYYYYEKNNKVTAFIGLMHFKLQTGSESKEYSWIVDWFASGNSVGEGLSLLRTAQKENTILCMQGSSFTRKILTTLHWKQYNLEGTLFLSNKNVCKVAKNTYYFRSLKLLHPFIKNVLKIQNKEIDEPNKLNFVEVSEFSNEIYDVIQYHNIQNNITIRDMNYLNYRFTEFPNYKYNKIYIKEGNKVIGYFVANIIIDRNGLINLRVSDILLIYHKASNYLFYSMLTFLKHKYSFDYLSIFIANKKIKEILLMNGFVELGSTAIWIPPNLDFNPLDWYITYIDCDRAWR